MAPTSGTGPIGRRPLRAVVFDVDGTLVDSERDGHRVAFNRAFEEAGLSYHWDVATYGELLRTTGGQRRLEAFLLDRGHDGDEAGDLALKLHEIKTAVFRDMVEAGLVPLRPGVARLVADLRGEGVQVLVATTGSRAWVEPLLDRHFPADTFALTVTGTEVTALKPDPAAYVEVVREAGLALSEVVAVEDSGNGLLAAKAAGLTCLVVTNDYTSAQDFTGADLVVDGFGPGADRVAGAADVPLPGGSVTVETLRALRAAGPAGSAG
ncbi:MAG TPA: HAD-IA family hydrolase [Nocardioidaceae bacterium]|nr:HAD-IA family hydrolase [Nocardioidaceae bacterium]